MIWQSLYKWLMQVRSEASKILSRSSLYSHSGAVRNKDISKWCRMEKFTKYSTLQLVQVPVLNSSLSCLINTAYCIIVEMSDKPDLKSTHKLHVTLSNKHGYIGLVSKAQNVLYFTLYNTLYNAGNQSISCIVQCIIQFKIQNVLCFGNKSNISMLVW